MLPTFQPFSSAYSLPAHQWLSPLDPFIHVTDSSIFVIYISVANENNYRCLNLALSMVSITLNFTVANRLRQVMCWHPPTLFLIAESLP